MAYTPTLWAKGDKVTSEKLNKIEQGIVDKVDKETGKTLSTNDFTDAYKTKLDGIEANADKTIIDATLTNSGAAADAKATGDAIKDIENDLDGKVAIIESDLDEKVENLKSLVGTPLKATTASDMTDTSKIYVYTGNESGYTNGDWYYHDGSAWVDGGTYNSVAVEVDDTLTVNGMPADAKVVGDEISSVKEDLQDLDGEVVKTVNGIAPTSGNVNVTVDADAVTDAQSMSDMTDTEKLYRYDGSIYYYNGTEWIEVGTGSGGGDTSELEADVNALKSNVYAFGTVSEELTLNIIRGAGYKTDGELYTNSPMRRVDDIDVSGCFSATVTTLNLANGWCGVVFFDSDHTLISYAQADGGANTATVQIPTGAKYMCLTHYGNDPTCTLNRYKTLTEVKAEIDDVIDAENLPNTSKSVAENIADTNAEVGNVSGVVEQIIDDFYKTWGTITDTLVPSVTSGEYYKVSDGTIGTYPACKRTDLIDISGWASANVTCYGLNTNYAGVCYYDKDQTYISGEYDNGRYTDAPLHIPANAKYIGVSSHNSFTISITYTRYITPSEVANTIDSLKTKVLDGYMDKNIVLFGDSLTSKAANGKWVTEIEKIMSFKSLTNYARGYCRWSMYADTVYDITSTGGTGSSDNVIWNQYNRLVADVTNEVVPVPDAIIIMAGTNDAIYNSNVGTVADVMAITDIRSAQVGTLNNVCASIRRVVEDIVATFPYTKIIICVPVQQVMQHARQENIVPCIRELCALYSIDTIDLYKNCGISYPIENGADIYLNPDGVHPNDNGGKLIANYIKAWLTSHYGYEETITKTYVPQS